MNTLVVFDSQCGGTEQIAQVIVSTLSHYGKVQAVDAAQTNGLDLKRAEMMIVGGPARRWRPSTTIQAFLDTIPEGTLKGLSLASFNTHLPMPQFMTRSAAKRLNKRLRKTGGALLLPSERFRAADRMGRLTSEEVERAARWARTVYRMHRAQQVFRRN
jgi:menaquinone-dependent protoporphyrinogen IX oxidase